MVSGFKSLFCKETLTVPLLLYAVIKLILPISASSSQATKLLRHLLYILLTLLLLPICIISLFLFSLYYEFIKFLCELYYRKDFHDGFHGADAMWATNTPDSKSTIQILFLLENKPRTPEKFMQFCKNPKFQDAILKNHPRLSCVKEYFLGYFFFIKRKVDYNQIINYIEDYHTFQDFQQVINRLTSKDLPYEDKFLWEILIGKEAIELTPGKLQYPVVMRYHHSLSDGITLSMFLLTNYTGNGIEIFEEQCNRFNKVFSKLEKPKPRERLTWMKVWNLIKTVMSKEVYLHHDMLHHTESDNLLHKELSGEKVICFSMEQDNDDLVTKIKKIKNKLNVSFADVTLGAISAALTEYFTKYEDEPQPKYLLSSNPYFLKIGELHNVMKVNTMGEPVVNLGNKFSLGFIKLPIDKKLLKNPSGFIYKLNKTTRDVKSSMDFAIIYWLFNIIATIVPIPVGVPLKIFYDASVIVTNVPGVLKLNFKHGPKVENLFVWTINYVKIGVTITLFTYDNQLRITMNIDRSLIRNLDDTQKICDDIIKYINIFHAEIVSTN